MKNTLYSLMLNDEVIGEVDRLARERGVTRSGLVNEILAEYVNYTTPERIISNVLSAVDSMFSQADGLISYLSPNSRNLSLKSSIAYRFRPTIKYDISLFKGFEDTIGEMTVAYRTQSAELISAFEQFFRMWASFENRYCPEAEHALYDGKFVRTIPRPRSIPDAETLAAELADYVRLFDSELKAWLCGAHTATDVDSACRAYFAARRY